ncbi:MAG: methyl-accepting chemotaxis protein [Thiohalomonadales bacterium]
MKNNQPVTNKEKTFPNDIYIVSTTSVKGIINSINQDFLDISGFTEEELINKNHNIIRHPDMPAAAFGDLWNDLKAGKSWMGVVKNRCKNGDFYWVDAYVTPIFKNGSVCGFQSVRKKPHKDLVERAEKFYDSLTSGFSLISKLKSFLQINLMWKIFIGYILTFTPIAVFIVVNSSVNLLNIVVATITFIVFTFIVSKLIASPWINAANEAKKLFSNDITQTIYTGRSDELGALELVIKAQQSQISTIIHRISNAAYHLDKVATNTESVIQQSDNSLQKQHLEIDQVATAMNEMSATVQEVAQNASNSADATTKADKDVVESKQVVSEAINGINKLADQISQASLTIDQLANDTESIGSVVDVIRSIAEQTNLLALNAAIEAARAGEQGRGFAVVADEVRTLASRTQSSTNEIQSMIESLQLTASQTVELIKHSKEISQQSVEQASIANKSLDAITESVARLSEMSTQIAAAAEQQSAVTEEINRNMVNINSAADESATASKETTAAISKIVNESTNLKNMVKQFDSK